MIEISTLYLFHFLSGIFSNECKDSYLWCMNVGPQLSFSYFCALSKRTSGRGRVSAILSPRLVGLTLKKFWD
jgi:hypothetical protein